ncbi:MAG: hypothetical protein IKL55_06180 [Clostridia bacterium]|nr:hypothetical protein [Clostridia bacterium]
MFVCNVKLNKKLIFKVSLLIMFLVAIILTILSFSKMISKSQTNFSSNYLGDSIPSSEITQIQPQNYTNILKAVHDDIDTYIGQKIIFSGYIYRLNGFSEDQFVLARDMDIGNNQTLVVGFLCSSEKAKEYPTYTWVNITGEITKGYYNGDIPVLKITAIEKASKPENATVCVPDSSYVPTAVIY